MKNKIIILLFTFVPLLLSAQKTEKFIVSIDIPNVSNKEEILTISRGTILTARKVDNENYQALAICDIEDSNLNYTNIENYIWRFNIPPSVTLTIKFKCYCINKGMKGPNLSTGVHITNMKIEKTQVDIACADQENMHSLVRKKSQLLLEDEYSIGIVNKENSCSDALKQAVMNIAKNKLNNISIYNIKYNGQTISDSFNINCTVQYSDSITFGLTKYTSDEVVLVNLRGNSDKSKNRKTIYNLQYDLKPSKSSIDLIEKCLQK